VIVALVGALLAATCPGQGATCPDVCSDCGAGPDPVDGTNPTLAEWRQLFVDVSQRQGASDLPAIGNLEVGASRTPEAAPFPCRLLPAIAATEAGMRQFCDDSGLTIISFDCGYGVMQVTSGAANYPGLEERADKNVAAGADILVDKWNCDGSSANPCYGGRFGDSDPEILESWYFAVWAYNGFVYANNPNNPDFDPSRAPYRSPGGLSRGSYPYQEIVWGYLRTPLERDGEDVVAPVEVSYPENIPDQSGLFFRALALPDVVHADPCTEECPPSGCPAAEDRTVYVDDADAAFTIDGASSEHAEGGFRDRFLSVAAAPTGEGDVVARFTGVAPSSGTFRVAGFIPLDPATSERVPVVVRARGAPKTFALDQSVAGGFFANLGEVVLLAGEPFVVEVTNGTGEAADVRLGVDAFRFTWIGDGAVAAGDPCDDDVDCAGDALCVDGACAAGCEEAGCADGASCEAATGACGAPPLPTDGGARVDAGDDDEDAGRVVIPIGDGGPGAGGARGGPGLRLPGSVVECACGATSPAPPFGALVVALAVFALRRRS
jgi:hypothetical protein